MKRDGRLDVPLETVSKAEACYDEVVSEQALNETLSLQDLDLVAKIPCTKSRVPLRACEHL